MRLTFLFQDDKELYKTLRHSIDDYSRGLFNAMRGVMKDIQGFDNEKRQEILKKHLVGNRYITRGITAEDGCIIAGGWKYWLSDGKSWISTHRVEETVLIDRLYKTWKAYPSLPVKMDLEDNQGSTTTNLGVAMAIMFLRLCNAGRVEGRGIAGMLIDMASDKEIAS